MRRSKLRYFGNQLVKIKSIYTVDSVKSFYKNPETLTNLYSQPSLTFCNKILVGSNTVFFVEVIEDAIILSD